MPQSVSPDTLALILKDVADYIELLGATTFLADLKDLYPEQHRKLTNQTPAKLGALLDSNRGRVRARVADGTDPFE